MGIKNYKPTTSGVRHKSGLTYEELTKKDPEKSLIRLLKRTGGRNQKGRTTMWHKGGGHKRRYRLVDFKRMKKEMPGRVKAIEYDPNRSCFIALIFYQDGEKSYILAPNGLKVGDEVISSEKADIKLGNCLSLKNIPTGTSIHNVELKPKKGGQLAKSAGSYAVLTAKTGEYCQVKLPSGEVRKILASCLASIGQVGNTDNENIKIGKAGRSRWLGKRPVVRGMAMNPIDHPLGGGEGVGKGNHPMTPWGVSCKGFKTRNNKRTDKFVVKKRLKKGKK